MISGIREFFHNRVQSISGGRRSDDPQRALQLATASLLIEVSRADHHIDLEEKRTIEHSVQRLFDLSAEETQEIVRLAEEEIDDATSLYEFTRLVNEHLDADQKRSIVENLWRVALADGKKDKYEEHIIRRVADLIHVSHSDFVKARYQIERSAY